MIRLLAPAVMIAALSMSTWAAEPVKKDNKAATQPAKKKANDERWKNNSLAKKQAECRSDPSAAKCAKKAPAKK